MSMSFFRKFRSTRSSRTATRAGFRIRPIEILEDRLTPANVSFLDGHLTLTYVNSDSTPENVSINNDGANITLSGDVTGTLSYDVGTVNQLTITDSGLGTVQSVTLTGSTIFNLGSGFSSTGVESVTFTNGVSANAVAVTAVNVNSAAGTGTIAASTSATFDITGTASSLAGDMSGAGSFTKSGAGVLELGGTNSFTGAVAINGGTLRANTATALGSTTATASVTVSSGGALAFASGLAFTTDRPLSLAGNGVGSGALDSLGGTTSATFSGPITLTADATVNSQGGDFTIANGFTGAFNLTVGGAGNTVLNGDVAVTGNLTKTGAGSLTLGFANTYTGNTTVNQGTLNTGVSEALGVGSSRTLTVTGSSTVVNLFNDAAATTTVHVANFATGTGQVVNTGLGKLIVTSQMSAAAGITAILTGGTSFTVQGNNIVVDSSLTPRTLTVSDGTLDLVATGTMSPTYRYYRFVPVLLRNPATNAVQLSELQFFLNNVWTAATTVTNPGGSNPSGEQPLKANDNSVDTKWLDFMKNLPLVYDFVVPTMFDEYNWATANDENARDPIRWTVDGSNDNVNWVTVDDRSGANQTVTTTRKAWVAPGASRFSGYSLSTVSISGGLVNVPNTNIVVTGSSTLSLGASGLNHVVGSLTLLNDGTALTLSNANSVSFKGISATGSSESIASGSAKVSLATGTAIDVGASDDLTISAVVGDGASATSMTKTGAGTLTLSGANSYTGATTLTGGVTSVSTVADGGVNSNLGAATAAASNLVFNGGTLQYTGSSASTNRNFTINTGMTATIDVAANTLTFTGVSAATDGALAKIGNGTLALNGVNLHTGTTSVSGGGLSLGNNASLAGSVSLGASTTLTTDIAGTISGGLTSTGGTITIGGAGTIGALTLSGALEADGATTFNFDFLNAVTFDTINAGANALTLSAAPIVNLAGSGIVSDTYDLITYGSVSGSFGVSPDSNPGGSFAYALDTTPTALQLIITPTIPSLVWDQDSGGSPIVDGPGDWDDGSGNFFDITNSSAATFDNDFSFDVTFGNGGAGGTITLTGPVRTGGSLIFATASSPYTIGAVAGTNTLTTVGGVIANNSATIEAPMLLEASQGWVTASGRTLTVNGTIGETTAGLSLTKSGPGTLVLGGAATYTGGTFITAGTVRLTNNDILPDAGAVSLTNFVGALLDLNDTDQVIGALSGGGASGGNITLGTGTLTFGDSSNTSFAGVISEAGGLVKQGSGTFTLSASQTYTGDTDIDDGVIVASVAQTFASGGIINIGSTGTLSVTAANALNGVTINIAAGGTLSPTIAGALNGATINILSGATFTPAVVNLMSAGGIINIESGGTLGANLAGSLTGAVVNIKTDANPLSPTVTDALSGATINVDGGTLAMGTFSSTVAGLTLLSGDVTGTTGVITSASNYAVESGSISAILAGTGIVLSKTTSGVVTLSGVNTYTGATNINAGTLTLSGSTAAASTVNIATTATLDGAGTVNGNATLTGGGIIEFTEPGKITGTLAVTGGNWNGAGSVTGQISVTSGTFTVAPGATLTADTGISLTGSSLNLTDATLHLGGAGLTGTPTMVSLDGSTIIATANTAISVPAVLSDTIGESVIDTNGFTVTASGALSGAGALSKIGAGTLKLTSATSTYGGGTTINVGIVAAFTTSALGTGPITQAGGQLSVVGGTYANDVIIPDGATTTTTTVATLANSVATFGTLTQGDGATLNVTGVNESLTGFGGNGAGWTRNGGATVTGDVATLTSGAADQARSIWNNDKVTIASGFQASYTYTRVSGTADGMAFVLQNAGLSALGAAGGSLGYSGITPSFAVQFNIYSNNTVGYAFKTNGSVTAPFTATGSVNLASGVPVDVDLDYDGTTLTMVLTQGVNTFSANIAIDLVALLGPQSYIGFTGATGGQVSTQTVQNFSFVASTGASYGVTFGQTSLTNSASINVANATFGPGNVTLGALDDGGVAVTLTKTGNGTLTLGDAAVSLVAGAAVNVDGGSLASNDATALGDTASVALAASTTFSLGASQTVGSLTGAGGVSLNGSELTVANDSPAVFDGIIADGSASGSLAKSGSSSLTLTNDSTFTGGTTISAGSLLVSGSLVSDVTVTGGTLGGTGDVDAAVDVNAGGTLAPGAASIGTLGVSDTLTLAGTSDFEVTKGGVPADQVTGIGELTYGGVLKITGVGAGSFAAGDSWDLFNFSSFVLDSGIGFANNDVFGTDGSLDPNMPDLTAGLTWEFDYATGILSIADSLAAPTVLSINPVIGPTTGGGTLVTILGANFTCTTSVTFDGFNAATFTVVSGTQINAVTAAHVGVGAVEVVVTNSAGSDSLAGTDDFTFAPSVSSVVVNGGPGVVFGASTFSLAGQHSVVKQILVTFQEAVTVAADAFTVTRRTQNVTVNGGAAPSTVAVLANSVTTISTSEYLVTFTGPGTHAGGVIDSGIYDLTTLASKVTVGAQTMAADQTTTFFAMFGNIEANNLYNGVVITQPIPPAGYSSGNGLTKAFVDPGSLFQFSDTFGSTATNAVGPPAYNVVFDYNLDGAIDPGDLFAFSDSFGIDWTF